MQRRSFGFCGNARAMDPRVFQTIAPMNNGVDIGMGSDDPGHGGITGKVEDRGRFQAPSLRNIALTAPYMHDGRFASLEEVVHFYAHRVRPHPTLDPRMLTNRDASNVDPCQSRASVNIKVEQQPVGLPLSSCDQRDLVAFLKTLTDLEFVTDPRFSDPFAAAAATTVTRRRATHPPHSGSLRSRSDTRGR
jgi:cytochrome c peroxidase